MGDDEFHFDLIDPKQLPEARSVAFWEAHVFYEMLWGERPVNLLDVGGLPKVPVYIVQGKGDDVCPPTYARMLESLLRGAGFDVNAAYVDDGHQVSGSGIKGAVRLVLRKFILAYMNSVFLKSSLMWKQRARITLIMIGLLFDRLSDLNSTFA